MFLALVIALAPLAAHAQSAPADIVGSHVYYHGEVMPRGLGRYGVIVFDCAGAHLHLRLPRDSSRHETFFRQVDQELAELSALGVFAVRGRLVSTDLTVYSLPIGAGTHWTRSRLQRLLSASLWIFGHHAGQDSLFIRGEVAAIDLSLVTSSCLPGSELPTREGAPDPLARFGLPPLDELISTPPPGRYDISLLPRSAATRGVDQAALLAQTIDAFRERLWQRQSAALDAITALGNDCQAFTEPLHDMGEATARIIDMRRRCPDALNRARRAILDDCQIRSAMNRSFYASGGSRSLVRDINATMTSLRLDGDHLTDEEKAVSSIIVGLTATQGREAELARFIRMNHCSSPGASTACASVTEEMGHTPRTECSESYADGFLTSTVWISSPVPDPVTPTAISDGI